MSVNLDIADIDLDFETFDFTSLSDYTNSKSKILELISYCKDSGEIQVNTNNFYKIFEHQAYEELPFVIHLVIGPKLQLNSKLINQILQDKLNQCGRESDEETGFENFIVNEESESIIAYSDPIIGTGSDGRRQVANYFLDVRGKESSPSVTVLQGIAASIASTIVYLGGNAISEFDWRLLQNIISVQKKISPKEKLQNLIFLIESCSFSSEIGKSAGLEYIKSLQKSEQCPETNYVLENVASSPTCFIVPKNEFLSLTYNFKGFNSFLLANSLNKSSGPHQMLMGSSDLIFLMESLPSMNDLEMFDIAKNATEESKRESNDEHHYYEDSEGENETNDNNNSSSKVIIDLGINFIPSEAELRKAMNNDYGSSPIFSTFEFAKDKIVTFEDTDKFSLQSINIGDVGGDNIPDLPKMKEISCIPSTSTHNVPVFQKPESSEELIQRLFPESKDVTAGLQSFPKMKIPDLVPLLKIKKLKLSENFEEPVPKSEPINVNERKLEVGPFKPQQKKASKNRLTAIVPPKPRPALKPISLQSISIGVYFGLDTLSAGMLIKDDKFKAIYGPTKNQITFDEDEILIGDVSHGITKSKPFHMRKILMNSDIEKNYQVTIQGRKQMLRVEEIVAYALAQLDEIIKQTLQAKRINYVISFPASLFNQVMLNALKDSLKIAGLSNATLVTECCGVICRKIVSGTITPDSQKILIVMEDSVTDSCDIVCYSLLLNESGSIIVMDHIYSSSDEMDGISGIESAFKKIPPEILDQSKILLSHTAKNEDRNLACIRKFIPNFQPDSRTNRKEVMEGTILLAGYKHESAQNKEWDQKFPHAKLQKLISNQNFQTIVKNLQVFHRGNNLPPFSVEGKAIQIRPTISAQLQKLKESKQNAYQCYVQQMNAIVHEGQNLPNRQKQALKEKLDSIMKGIDREQLSARVVNDKISKFFDIFL